MKRIYLPVLLFMIILPFGHLFAAPDSLIFTNGSYMVGKIKSMNRGVLIVKTDYSDQDFKIEWSGIEEIYTFNFFLISLTDGTRYNGNIQSVNPGNVLIESPEGNPVIGLGEIVYLQSVDTDVWSRIYASVDVSLNLAKANNLRQFTTSANAGYRADRWSTDMTFSTLFSERDEVSSTRRTDGSGAFNWFLPKDWYVPISISFLSNTEQKLDLRTNALLGVGHYIIHSNSSYWGFSAGASFNNEKYSNEETNRDSWEGYLSTELNLYDIGDLSLLTKATIYPGITDLSRFRSDFSLDTKYDLPLDFYIKFTCTVNYDNHPAKDAGKTDYVLQTGFGWEW